MGEIGSNRESDHWLDVAVFEEKVNEFMAKPLQSMENAVVSKLEGTLKLYTGELLEGFYDDWALRERERLRSLYLKSLARLMNYSRREKDYEKGLACGKRILNLHPLREEVHREVIRLYFESGD
jgi:two-component SAPR family response regulator